VRKASLDLFTNETLAIVGESGSGKSVFAKSFLGMLDKNGSITGGSLMLDGRDLTRLKTEKEWLKIRGKEIAMVFQDPMTSLNPVKTVGAQISEVLRWHFKMDKEKARSEAIELLKMVGIEHAGIRYKQYPHEFSGGMRQRVVIATAIACKPRILICDEPTTALDVTVQSQILELIRKLQAELAISVVYITHDLGVVANVADRVSVMYAGQIIEYGSVGEIFKAPEHPYTKALLRSLPQMGERGKALHSIIGSPPNLFFDVKGDAFAPRNPDAMRIDYALEPPFFKVSDTHYAKTWLLHEKAAAHVHNIAEKKREPEEIRSAARPGGSPLLSLRGLTVNFKLGGKEFSAVKDVSFDIYPGETFALVGESGSGKTTIGKAIMKICHTNGGDILFDGVKINRKFSGSELTDYRRQVQMIFQDPMASLNERAKVEYIISEGLLNFRMHKDEDDRKARVKAMMNNVGLHEEYVTRFPHEFSGGQRQRIGIARSLIVSPRLVVADEPISALDVSIRAQVINLMNRMKAERNLTYLFIAHDLSVVRYFADRIAVMYKGRIVELSDGDELFRRPLHPYTRSLLASAPVPDPEVEKAKKAVLYDYTQHDYERYKPSWTETSPGHFVWANEPELEEYIKREAPPHVSI